MSIDNKNNKNKILISVKNLYKSFYNNHDHSEHIVLKNICVDINQGDVVCILGLSGGGKSTFLRCLNLLEKPSSGNIFINNINMLDKNANINKIRQKIGMVFQQFNLFPHLNIYENLTLAPKIIYKKKDSELKPKACKLLNRVGLIKKINNYPATLSGGEKQRIAIIRALMMKPEILLFDEPTSALDPTMVGEVLKVMRDLAKAKMTMLIVTHEMGFAKEVANRILFLDSGELIFDASPDVFFNNTDNNKINQFLSFTSFK